MKRKIKTFLSRVGRPGIIVATATVLILGAIVGLFVYDGYVKSSEAARRAEFEERVRPINVEKSALVHELDLLDKIVMDELGAGGCLPIVVYGTHTDLYDYLYPHFNGKRGEGDPEGLLPSVGIVALSPTELPDLEGRITRAQFDEIIASGWQPIVYYGGEGELGEHLDVMEEEFEKLGLAPATAVLFRSSTYTSAYDEMLKERGINCVFHSGEEYMEYIEEGPLEEGGLWHVGSVGWNTYGVSSAMLTTLLSTSGVMAFTVDFNYGTSGYDGTNTACIASFGRMVEKLDAYRVNGDLFISNIANIEMLREGYIEQAAVILGENGPRRQQLKEEIAELERRISEIYEEYKVCFKEQWLRW